MRKTVKHLSSLAALLLFTSVSYADCISFSFGVQSADKNEFAFYECKTKQVFQNSDLFNKKKDISNFFIGESILIKNINHSKINKALKFVIAKSTKRNMKKNLSSHSFHFTVNKQSYQIDHKSFSLLKSILHLLKVNSKNKNGVLIKKEKLFKIKNSMSKGSVDLKSIKSFQNFYYYNGLYWSK